MVKYVYYSEPNKQIQAVFDTPNLSDQENWVAKGYLQALVPEGLEVTRDHRILTLDDAGFITFAVRSVNPVQRAERPRNRLKELTERLADDTITPSEVRELMRLERGL